MSRGIWTRCVGDSEPPFRRFGFTALRVVESQHMISTRRLVDSDDEQALLEQMIDRVKPPIPPELKRLHYLLSTPFRHPPLRWGSRFGGRDERSLWYGSRAIATAFAEVAYYRFVFLAGTRAGLTPLSAPLTSFRVQIATRRGIDLTREPFHRQASSLTSPTRTDETKVLGRDMRAAGVEAFLYTSARDPGEGLNVGLFTPCFARPRPYELRTWTSITDTQRVEIVERDMLARTRVRFAFERSLFEVDGSLPVPSA